MAIRVLGPLETGSGPGLSPRERVMLAALIVLSGRAVAPGELAEAYWGEGPPRTWPQQVKTSIARIRTGLGAGAVLTRGSDYALGIEPSTVDAFEFERLVSIARQHSLHGEHDRAIDAYRRALGLWRGAAYVDIADWEPAAIEAERLAEIRHSAEEELLEARLADGEHRAVIADAERLVRESPLRESRWAILAMANYRAGRQAEALSTIRAARARLADDLGIDIGDRLRTLESSMLQHDPSLAPVEARHRVSAVCPYRGLLPFAPSDTEDFFGRDADIDAIVERLRTGSLTIVVGASGSGKSSLVLAGVVPRVSPGRRVAVLTAGRDAAADLRARIDERGAADIVVIDQAEAVFQLADAERDELCRLVAEVLAVGAAVLMTLRSDFLDRATGLPHIGALIGRGVYAIGPLDADGLREAIARPAARAGLRLEPGLVELILRDAADRRTTLPHVSHALVETWARREGATLTVAGYEASGGIAGAIAQSAESVYRSFDPEDADACRSLVLRLVHRGADGASVRRAASLGPLVGDQTRRRVLERLVAARLLTTDGDEVTVAHEALATAWPRLDGWLEEDAEGARLVAAVATAAELWNASGRRSEDLVRGARLQAALDWREASQPDLTRVEREFLDASAERERDEVRELAERAARDRRNNLRLRWAIAGAGVLLVAAIVGGGLAAVRGEEAQAAAENAGREALVATSLSLLDVDRDAAALLAAEAFRRWPDDARVRSALWGVITNTGGVVSTHHQEGAYLPAMAMIPGTTTALRVASSDEEADRPAVDIVDIDSGDVVDTFGVDLPEAVQETSRTVAVSPDGSTAAIRTVVYPDPSNPGECCWNHLAFVDLAAGEPLPATTTVRAQLAGPLVWDEAGRTLYVVHAGTAAVIAVDAVGGEIRSSGPVQEDHPVFDDPPRALALVDDVVVVGTGDELRLYDPATLHAVRSIPVAGDVTSQDVIEDAQGGVLTTGMDGTARVVLSTGETLWRREVDPTRNCTSLYLASDTAVACGSYEGIVLLELASGDSIRTRGAALGLNTSPRFGRIDEGSLLVTVDTYPIWMRWRIDGGGAGSDVVALGRELVDGPEEGGALVVTQPVGGGLMQLWDVARDAPVGEQSDEIVPLGSGVYARYDDGAGPVLERIPTGERIVLRVPGLPEDFRVSRGSWTGLAFASWQGGVAAFDPSTGEPVGSVIALPEQALGYAQSVSETPDGRLAVITWSQEEDYGFTETAVFEIATGELLVRGLMGLDQTHTIDGDELIGITGDYARWYDLKTLEPVAALARAAGGSKMISVSADGRTLLNVGFNNVLTLYDLTVGAPLAAPLDSDAPGQRLLGGHLAPDGETLLEALPDGIRLWELRPALQAALVYRLAGRELTAEEWSTYFPGEPQVSTCAALTS